MSASVSRCLGRRSNLGSLAVGKHRRVWSPGHSGVVGSDLRVTTCRACSSTASPLSQLDNPLELPPEVFADYSSAKCETDAHGVNLFYSDWAEMPLGPRHRFPIDKYRQVREQLQKEDKLRLHRGPLATYKEACLAHDETYVESILTGRISEKARKRVGFNEAPLRSYVLRTLASLGATAAATRHCLSGGTWSGAVSGGTHHAFADMGEGFCVFNDIAVAARIAQREFGIATVLVVDLDVHQGNGTSGIFRTDNSVFTLDVHQAKGFPFSTRSTSDLDIPLPDKCCDSKLIEAMSCLPRLFQELNPGLVIYQAGVDGLAGDRFGRLALTREGLVQRNAIVYELCAEHGVPLVVTMGGGYHKEIKRTVESSADVYRQMVTSVAQ